MKIIGGIFRNRTLKAPKTELSKPTTAILRKSVFDICQNHIEGAQFLDLFSCSGAVGIEALSRGAAFATFVEKDKLAVTCLYENIKTFHLESQTKVFCSDVFSQIKKLGMQEKKYNIVYIDPPYSYMHSPQNPVIVLLHFLDESNLLADDALVFLEEGYPSFTSIENINFIHLRFKNSRKFGKSLLHQFYKV